MAIIIGTNSWATVAEADAYLTNKVGTSSWFALAETPTSPGDPSKESYLIMSYEYLLSNCGYSIPADSTDENVKKAQIEFAYYLLNNQEAFDERSEIIASGVKEFKASKWSEKYADNLNGEVMLPRVVQNYLKGYYLLNVTMRVPGSEE